MKQEPKQDKVIRFQLPQWNWEKGLKFLVVLGLTAAGVGAVMAGLLAWVVGEEFLLLTGVLAGAVLIAAGGLGLLRCLDRELR